MRIHGVNTVVIGSFNPKIIDPNWLHKHRIDTGQVEMLFNVGLPNVSTFKFKDSGIYWKASTERLEVSCDEMKDTAKYVKNVLKLLPHTPVTAVGFNFNYICESDAWIAGTPTLTKVKVGDWAKYGDMSSRSWKVSLNRENKDVWSVDVRHTDDEVVINLNIHRQVAKTKQAMEATDHFEKLAREAKRCVRDVFKQELKK